MSIAPVTPGSSAAATSQTQIAGNFDTFLKLLTTQLQYQDPMSPMDSNQFTQQLVQFASVEQSIATNKNLESLVNLTLASATSNAVGYIGREVTAGGDTASLTDAGNAEWHYTLPANAAETDIVVTDGAGKPVYAGKGETAKGEHVFTWDGRTSNGNTAPPGNYKIVISAQDPGGNQLGIEPVIKGIVTSVDIQNGTPMLNVGSMSLKLTDIISVGAPPAPVTSPNGSTT